MYKLYNKNSQLKDSVEKFFIEHQNNLDQQTDYYVDLVIGGNPVATTNKFIKTNINGVNVFEVDFFANNVVIPFDQIQYMETKLIGYNLNSENRTEITEFYYKTPEDYIEHDTFNTSEQLTEIKLKFHDLPVNDHIKLDTEVMRAKGYSDCHNVLRCMNGLTGLGYCNA